MVGRWNPPFRNATGNPISTGMPMISGKARVSMPAALVVAVLLGIAPAGAQAQGTGQPAAPKQPPPRVIIEQTDIYRGPPAPPERQIAPPRSGQEIAPPMPRLEALPPMLPRVGN
jgi:hypothetical protein